MTGVRIDYRIDNAEVISALRELVALGEDATDVMRAIATYGEASTRERFETETGPDGEQWKPSLRAKLSGGRTLTLDGHLGDSISPSWSSDTAEWGSNREYAAIHQEGGEIRAKSAGGLRFQIAGGGFVTAQKVSMPARPYLGLSAADEDEIEDIVLRKIAQRLG